MPASNLMCVPGAMTHLVLPKLPPEQYTVPVSATYHRGKALWSPNSRLQERFSDAIVSCGGSSETESRKQNRAQSGIRTA